MILYRVCNAEWHTRRLGTIVAAAEACLLQCVSGDCNAMWHDMEDTHYLAYLLIINW